MVLFELVKERKSENAGAQIIGVTAVGGEKSKKEEGGISNAGYTLRVRWKKYICHAMRRLIRGEHEEEEGVEEEPPHNALTCRQTFIPRHVQWHPSGESVIVSFGSNLLVISFDVVDGCVWEGMDLSLCLRQYRVAYDCPPLLPPQGTHLWIGTRQHINDHVDGHSSVDHFTVTNLFERFPFKREESLMDKEEEGETQSKSVGVNIPQNNSNIVRSVESRAVLTLNSNLHYPALSSTGEFIAYLCGDSEDCINQCKISFRLTYP